MHLTSKSIGLLIAALLLLVLNLADPGSQPTFSEPLPSIAGDIADDVRRIELSTSSSKLVLQRDEGGEWQVTAPFSARADRARVRSFLNVFREPLDADVRVDEGNPEEYGLDAGGGIVAELWTDEGAEPAISYTVGFDTPGGSSFIRISGDDAVYRARVGGRSRYEQPPIAWRNQVLLDFDYERAVELTVTQGAEQTLHFLRDTDAVVEGDSIAPWRLEPEPDWDLDTRAVDAMVRMLGQLRAGGILTQGAPEGFEEPVGVVRVLLDTGAERTLTIGSIRPENGIFVQVNSSPETYQVSAAVVERTLQTPEAFRDRTIFNIPVEDVELFSLEQGSNTIILQQNEPSRWSVLQPQNIDFDIQRVYYGINNFTDLRAERRSPADLKQAGLLSPSARVTTQLIDGRSFTLEIGLGFRESSGATAFFVRRIKNAFGRL
ncbi:MAG: hypothetical protein ACI8S6_000620 [Myxococcota bacterium]|jgi:hypothetical protein